MKPKERQYSLRALMASALFVALLIAVFWITYHSSREEARLEAQLQAYASEIRAMQSELSLARGQSLRTRYAEKMLFYVLAHSEDYPELVAALKNGSERQVGMSLHSLDEDDNRTYLNFYSINRPADVTPFCFSFLLADEPFEVLGHIAGEQSRVSRKSEGQWVCGAGRDGKDVSYLITKDGFEPLEPES
ncbi:MAG: hypothetical protein AAFX06_23840 [Planctomycetota bacterium]